jgi:hypothetical protein
LKKEITSHFDVERKVIDRTIVMAILLSVLYIIKMRYLY